MIITVRLPGQEEPLFEGELEHIPAVGDHILLGNHPDKLFKVFSRDFAIEPGPRPMLNSGQRIILRVRLAGEREAEA